MGMCRYGRGCLKESEGAIRFQTACQKTWRRFRSGFQRGKEMRARNLPTIDAGYWAAIVAAITLARRPVVALSGPHLRTARHARSFR